LLSSKDCCGQERTASLLLDDQSFPYFEIVLYAVLCSNKATELPASKQLAIAGKMVVM
jgi:hypothetical protein